MDWGKDLLVMLVPEYEMLDSQKWDLDMVGLVKEKLGDMVIWIQYKSLWSGIYYKQKYNWKQLGLNRLGGVFGRQVGKWWEIVWLICGLW